MITEKNPETVKKQKWEARSREVKQLVSVEKHVH